MQPQVVAGRYELVRSVGAGGMGQVFEGFDRNLKRRIALKLTSANLDAGPEWTKRFYREAELMAGVSHPGMPTIHDAGIHPGHPDRPFLVMEFVEGRTWEQLLAHRGPLPIGVVASLGAQAAAVLAATHRHRVYHRDLKPANLMMCDNGTVKVLDFGLAVALDGDFTRYSNTGQTLGTPAFMAPEQIEGDEIVPQTDLYALGLVLHELLTGRRVMTGSNPYVVWRDQVHTPAPDIRLDRGDTPLEMASLIMSMVEKMPSHRPEDAATVHNVLLRHATQIAVLPEVGDRHSPVHMYARAVSAPAASRTAPTMVADAQSTFAPSVSAPETTKSFSRGEIRAAMRSAREFADQSRYQQAIQELSHVLEAAQLALGSRDVDVFDARIELADLRFESGNYPVAAGLFLGLVDDLTAERGPYDEQAMYCRRQLAGCKVHLGQVRDALAELGRLHGQMLARYGADDKRVIDIGAQITHIRAT
ncbi:serine/threonine-protein kinase [Nocardia coubleae]|uniref:Serine/threonine protein kinase n=1 Tax=Nocardia coubleae TaxID=356147 RepID=A0A846WCB3_9NOCA|nr:serine/threonine-protein kinase [Nocardia coubleae]NKX90941.1 serine/threonine protein kinase [Nocardia coubleae]